MLKSHCLLVDWFAGLEGPGVTGWSSSLSVSLGLEVYMEERLRHSKMSVTQCNAVHLPTLSYYARGGGGN
jgi:hypothetical protein